MKSCSIAELTRPSLSKLVLEVIEAHLKIGHVMLMKCTESPHFAKDVMAKCGVN